MVVMVTGARLVFAMSRDARFPVHQLMRRVDPRTQTPIPATILILAGGILAMVVLPGQALLQLIIASTILPVLLYAATVVLYLAVRTRLGRKEGAFDLGHFELPVAIVALVWLVVALFILAAQGESFVAVLIVAGCGGLYFLGMLMFDRKSLWPEPGDIPVIAVRN